MSLSLSCLGCNLNQALKVLDGLGLDPAAQESAMREVLSYLSQVSYDLSNPEIMGGTWEIIVRHGGNPDPYREIKQYYNGKLLAMSGSIEALIASAPDPFTNALKTAIAGNLIDFAAQHTFDLAALQRRIEDVLDAPLARDDSPRLQAALTGARTLLYLGDNCGEIVLDKLFIQRILREFPVKVYYAVRGRPIINDATLADARQVAMEEVATVLENGDSCLGTVLSRVSPGFRRVFEEADVIIAKGQGNYESLMDAPRSGLFHLFMAKCQPVAAHLKVPSMSIVCMEKKA
jgi:uncharacterized protein with ATP-grasp and redox domains